MFRTIGTRTFVACAGLLLVGVLGCSRSTPTGPQGLALQSAITDPQLAAAVQRPLSDFLSAQGTTAVFIPPLPDLIAWANNNPQTLFVSVDYEGVIASYLAANGGPSLGTRVKGTVSERPLADGRAEVSVILHTDRALTWAMPLPGNDFAADPLVFGYRGTDLLADTTLTPALSSADFQIVFNNTAPGAPLPDLVNAFALGNAAPGQEIVRMCFRSQGVGPFRALSGFAEGSPGRCTVVQTGLFQNPFRGAVADGFPAERVNLQPVGGGGGRAISAE